PRLNKAERAALEGKSKVPLPNKGDRKQNEVTKSNVETLESIKSSLIGTNFRPSAAQEAFLKSCIGDLEDCDAEGLEINRELNYEQLKVDTALRKMAKLQSRLQANAKRRSDLQTRALVSKALLSPVRFLPLEILLKVFFSLVDDEDDRYPAFLAFVCTTWRAVALGDISLWSKSRYKLRIETDGSIYYNEIASRPNSHRYCATQCITPLFPRISRIYLCNVNISQVSYLHKDAFPSLVTLELEDCVWDYYEHFEAFNGAKCLRNFTTSFRDFDRPPELGLALAIPWRQLTHVHLKDIDYNEEFWTMFLNDAEHLEELSLVLGVDLDDDFPFGFPKRFGDGGSLIEDFERHYHLKTLRLRIDPMSAGYLAVGFRVLSHRRFPVINTFELISDSEAIRRPIPIPLTQFSIAKNFHCLSTLAISPALLDLTEFSALLSLCTKLKCLILAFTKNYVDIRPYDGQPAVVLNALSEQTRLPYLTHFTLGFAPLTYPHKTEVALAISALRGLIETWIKDEDRMEALEVVGIHIAKHDLEFFDDITIKILRPWIQGFEHPEQSMAYRHKLDNFGTLDEMEEESQIVDVDESDEESDVEGESQIVDVDESDEESEVEVDGRFRLLFAWPESLDEAAWYTCPTSWKHE
ncbi:hypothetical protein H0H93_007592, partial [Arthromyces matolae]